MFSSLLHILARFSRFGVLHREEVKNDLKALRRLLRGGFVQKVYRRGKVFYELTPQALPLLDCQRHVLLDQAKILAQVATRSPLHRALVEDVRFVDETHPDARRFLFLGDWQLQRSVLPAQLALAKHRYYQSRGLM